VDSLWLIMEAVKPWASCQKFRKTCSSAEGSDLGARRAQDLGVDQEGPGQGDLLPFSYAKVSRRSELVAPQAVVAFLRGADGAVRTGAFCGMEDAGRIYPNQMLSGTIE
jgi:hypothetical protein